MVQLLRLRYNSLSRISLATLLPQRRPNSTSSQSSPESPSAPSNTPATAVSSAQPPDVPNRKLTLAERDAAALKRFEERFGGQEATALGVLEDGKPEGLARAVRKNMFR